MSADVAEGYGPAIMSTVTINAPGRICHKKTGVVVSLHLATNEATVQLRSGTQHIIPWSAGLDAPFPHGTTVGHHRGCSCLECREAINRYHRGHVTSAVHTHSRHGTRARYRAGCRCDLCRAANAKHVRNWRHA